MRVAMILNSFPEISEKFLLNQIIALLQVGIDLDIYSAHTPEDTSTHDLFEQYHVGDHVINVGIPRNLKKRILKSIPIFLALLFSHPLIAFRCMQFSRYKTAAKNTKLIWFSRAFSGKKYDIIHCHFGTNGLIGAFLKDCGFTKKLVTTFHGSDINSYPSRHGLDVYKTLYEVADLITVNTSFTGNKVEMNGCSPNIIRVLPVGLLPSDYDTVVRDSIQKNSILTVGRLVEKKGHEFLARALPKVIEKHPNTHWFIVGDGHLRNKLEELVKYLKIETNVTFLGQCENTVVKDFYSRSEIFVLPSVTAPDGDMEGQALVLQEAQYCKIPIISTLHNGIPDGVLDGESGYLVPEKDSDALSEKILHLFSSHELVRSMGQKGYEFVKDRYDTIKLAKKLKDWYEEII